MARYVNIRSAVFDGAELPLPLSARIGRRREPLGSYGDADAFVPSVQTAAEHQTAEVRLRGTAAAEALTVGGAGDLVLTLGAGEGGSPQRVVTLSGAVLVGVDLAYEQSGAASAKLQFVAESADGTANPFAAEDQA